MCAGLIQNCGFSKPKICHRLDVCLCSRIRTQASLMLVHTIGSVDRGKKPPIIIVAYMSCFREHSADRVSSRAADHQAPGTHGHANNATSCAYLQRLSFIGYTSSCSAHSPTRWLDQFQFIVQLFCTEGWKLVLAIALLLLLDRKYPSNDIMHLLLSPGCGYKCYSSPHQAHQCGSCWSTGLYLTFKIIPI